MASFFGNRAHVHVMHTPHTENNFIKVGNEQFHAVAVALIDSMQTGIHRGNDVGLKKILESVYKHFPKYVNSQPYLTISERMKIMLDNSRKSELVECMAYSLRQLTVDEFYTHPLMYREVFKGLNPDTPKSYLRDPTVKLPASALNAVAQTLDISITLSFKELGKELRKRDIYEGVIAPKIKLEIQVQGDQYFPSVKNKADFAYVGQLAISGPKPVENAKEQGETIRVIFEFIEADNEKKLRAYKRWCVTILTMVGAGELSAPELLDHFTSLPSPSPNTLSLVDLMQLKQDPAIAGIPEEAKQELVVLLASAMAHRIATEQIPDSIFDTQPIATLK